MMKPILSTHLYFSSFLHIIVVTIYVAGDSPSIYKPVEDITVNCGSLGNIFNAYDNRSWSGDINSKFSPLEPQAVGNTSIFNAAPHSYKVQQMPYTTARLSHSEFTYRFFSLTQGQKFIRLYFYPASYPDFDPSKALFSVKAGGFTLLHDFNASVTAAASGLAFGPEGTVYREFCMNIGEEEEEEGLNITFSPSRAIPDAYAFINGIEIVSMPTNLYYTAPEDTHRIQLVGDSETYYSIENSTAMEMVYRFNIGGNSVSFNKDTGMYRNWLGYVDELSYLEKLNLPSVMPQNFTIKLNFVNIAEYTAPAEVYETARSMGPNKTINKNYNLTWEFPVDPLFSYLVRLHFCEFQSEITQAGDRKFLIYMANQSAEENADIMIWSDGKGRPVYKDYLVVRLEAGPGGRQKKVNLSLALQANPDDLKTRYNDVLLNGLEIFKLNDTMRNLAGPNPDPPVTGEKAKPSLPEKPNKSTRTTMLAIIGGVVVSSILVVLSVLVYLVFRRQRKVKESECPSRRGTNSSHTRDGSSLPSKLCDYFSLAEIKAATRNFSDICVIGHGGFGNVYKGYIDGGATPVAVKRLKPESSQGAHEFKTEIEMLSQLRHRHLVSLIGYCADQGEMILVYDFMDRGSLSDHLYNTDNPSLSWEQRLEICIGAGRGLHYLHTGTKYTIIHRDVKSSNILLDEKWVAKVSDFGLSKIGTITMSKTHISTVVKGSFGYLDPEYYRRQQLTEKSDVYSFGVVLCEVLCARPALIRTVEKKQMSLADWTRICHRNGTLYQIIDPNLSGKIAVACFNKFIEIAVSCINDNGAERPSMNDVVRGLEFALELQNCAEKDLDNNFVERKGEDEVAFPEGKEGLSGSEQSYATTESIKGTSGTIFSEINDSEGR
ncbi:hypothetical protein L3X38_025995 [Prunus dulcis]|uniref:Protein kinase domain-containing protein n=1 Tax=Prunus dulcis TaxID=3755 RepID=A0AAD4W3I3_PRUDU|nr:hypothetical protein L3X38_025995 [Prunus dulcis]